MGLNKVISGINSEGKKENLKFIILQHLVKNERNEATELLCKTFLEQNKVYTTRDDEKSEIWIYNKGIYVPQAKTYIKEFCREILTHTFTSQIANQVISKIETDTYIDQKDFFINEDKNLIPVLNGIYNLKQDKLFPFSDKYFFFNKIPIAFKRGEDCPHIKRFFKDVLPNGDDKIMQELFGYLLYREYKIEKACMFLGNGRNGKGKTNELMKRFIGTDNCTNIPLQDLDKDQYSMSELFNKLANLSADISKTALKETGNFKALTGRDLIGASRKFLTRVNFVNYAKLIFSANELPQTKDITDAFFLRWIILNFPYQFVSQKEYDLLEDSKKENVKIADPEIIEKIATDSEMSGLFNHAIVGLKKLLENGDFSYSTSASEIKNIWLRKSSSIVAFIMDHVEKKSDAFIVKSKFRELYNEYCSRHKLNNVDNAEIKETLAKQIGVLEARRMTESGNIRVWKGIIIEKKDDGIG